MGSLFQENPVGKISSLARAFALVAWMPIILALSLSPLLSHSQIFADAPVLGDVYNSIRIK